MWSYTQSVNFTLGNSLFGTVRLTKNANLDKYSYLGYWTDAGGPSCHLMVLGMVKK